MKKSIIIIGCSGHGAEIDEYLLFSPNENKILGFIDDNSDNYLQYKFSAPYLGGINDHIVNQNCLYIIGIANLEYRRTIVELFLKRGAKFLSLIHPSAYVSPTAKLGVGTVIGPMVNIGPNVVIGDFTLINSRCSLGHDTLLGAFNFLAPNVSLSGFTRIGNDNLFGINSATIPGITVGNNNKITAGMVLDKKVKDNEIIFFRHKERIIAIPKKS